MRLGALGRPRPRAPADAQLEAWAREEAQLDGPATTASAILEAPPPPLLAELAVSPTTPLTRVGHVEGFAEEGRAVLIRGLSEQRAVVEGTALFLEDRRPLGCVSELFGPVAEPFYLLRLREGDAPRVQAYASMGAVAACLAGARQAAFGGSEGVAACVCADSDTCEAPT